MIHYYFGSKEGLYEAMIRFEEQMGRTMDAGFLDQLAHFNGRLIGAGLSSMLEPSNGEQP